MMLSDQKTLLIVDDDAPLRMALCELFGESGCRVRCAEDGFSALREIRQEIPDIVLSDLNMPGMSGFEFLFVVRRRFPSIRVIAMSGAYSGSDLASLRQIVEAMTGVNKPLSYRPATPPGTPWIVREPPNPAVEPALDYPDSATPDG
jgi:CheY-like chemotaxis protein